MKHWILFLLCIALTACEEDPLYIQVVDKISQKYIQEASSNTDFVLSEIGGGMMGDIQRVAIGFDSFQCLDIPAVRKLMVDHEEIFLNMLNENKEVRPFLHSYPVTAKNFELSFGFVKLDGSFVEAPCIAYASMHVDEICYTIYNKEKRMLEEVLCEPYSEAYQKVYSCDNCDR